MSTYPIPELLQRWRKGELTTEQAVGHILQNFLDQFQWRTEVEKRLRQLEEVAAKPQK